MKEGKQNLDDVTPAEEIIPLEALDAAEDTALLPTEGQLREGMSVEECAKLSADLEVFYIAQVEAIESGEGTMADIELVEFAQAIQESVAMAETSDGEMPVEITTSAEALKYLQRPSLMERLNGKARKAIVFALSATAFAAAMPVAAQGPGWGGKIGQMIQYGVQRGTQEIQTSAATNMQIAGLKNSCDMTVTSIQNQAESTIGSLQIQSGVNLQGVDLLSPDVNRQFQASNPGATPQQVGAFNQMRQVAFGASGQVRNTVAGCNSQMKNISQTAEYQRTMRLFGDIPAVINVIR